MWEESIIRQLHMVMDLTLMDILGYAADVRWWICHHYVTQSESLPYLTGLSFHPAIYLISYSNLWAESSFVKHMCRNIPGMGLESWWRNQMEKFSALLAICVGNSPVRGEFPAQRPVTGSFDVFFDLHPNKRLSTQLRGWWFETPSCPLWRHRNGLIAPIAKFVM